MKMVIRRNVFETNSSSMHSVTIAQGNRTDSLPVEDGKIVVTGNEFGWELETYNNAYIKLSYLITLLFGNIWDNSEEYKEKKDMIDEETGHVNPDYLSGDRRIKFEKLKNVVKNITGCELIVKVSDDYYPFGYIDHQSWGVANDIIEDDEEVITNFIFNPKSVLITDNDNH